MRFVARTTIAAPPSDVFAWHARPGAFERLVPPWSDVRVTAREGGIEDGARTTLQMRIGPVPVRWEARHRDYVAGRQFADEQVSGPFARWLHTHRFLPSGEGATTLEDDIEYAPPLGPLGGVADALMIRRDLARTFVYRHRTTKGDIEVQRRYAGPAMRIAVTGSSGLLGSHLVPFLTTAGHDVVKLVRGRSDTPGTAGWSPDTGVVDERALGEVDAVVHLAGAGIADRRWSDDYKREIRDSRTGPTEALCRQLASRSSKPAVLVCASAIGYYGDRGAEILDENSPPGKGFLPEVCVAWERAASPAAEAGIRVVHVRIGIVLSPRGGALKKMLPPFLLGAGGRIGSGQQYMSWVSMDDVLGAVYFALRSTVSGPLNATAPAPVTNAAFTATLARVLNRPALVPVPAFAVRAMFGEMGDTLLLGGQRVLPQRLAAAGFTFRHPELEPALRHLLGR